MVRLPPRRLCRRASEPPTLSGAATDRHCPVLQPTSSVTSPLTVPLQARQLDQARLEHQAVLSEQAELQARHSLRDDWMEALQVVVQAQQAEQAAQQAHLAAAIAAAGSSDGMEASQASLQLAAWLETAASSRPAAASGRRYVPTLAAAMASALRTSPGVLAALQAITPAKMIELYDSVLARLAELLATVEAKRCKRSERQVADLMVESVSVLAVARMVQHAGCGWLTVAAG